MARKGKITIIGFDPSYRITPEDLETLAIQKGNELPAAYFWHDAEAGIYPAGMLIKYNGHTYRVERDVVGVIRRVK